MKKLLSNIKPWFYAIRPKTLVAALVPVCVGTALSFRVAGQVDLWIFFCILVSALCIQIATNFFNDAIDFKKGADTKDRLGPKRFTNDLSFEKMLGAGVFLSLCAIAFGIPLVREGGWPILSIGFVSLAFAYFYTGGPFPLAYVGLGDIFVILFFGIVAVMGTYFLQTGSWSETSLVAGLQIGFLASLLIIVNNLRDMQTDLKVGKKTLAVRIGYKWSLIEVSILLIGSFGLQFFWLSIGYTWAALIPFLSLPLGLRLFRLLKHYPPSARYNQFLELAAKTHILFGLSLGIGLLI